MQFYGKMQTHLDRENSTITVKEGYKRFQNWNVAKNLAETTIKHYNNCFEVFSTFFDITRLCNSITEDTIFEFIVWLKKNRNINDITLNTYIRAIRAMLYYFMKQGYTQPFQIQSPKMTKKAKETYNDYELTILLEKPQINKVTFTEYRNWVIVNYLLATGNREGTVSNIKIGDIHFDSDVIHLRKTKNRREQIVPMAKSLSKVLKEYLRYRKGNEDDYLFCSVTGGRLTENGLRLSIRKYNQDRGVNKTSVHLFRHTFAKKWILNGGDVFRLQKLLGHSSMEIVKQYVNMFSEDLKRDFDHFNPLEEFQEKSKVERGKYIFKKNEFRK